MKCVQLLGMDKTEAIRLLGGTATSAAELVGVSLSAVGQWPDPLPQRIADRVQAALWRKAQGLPPPTESQAEAKAA